jgi:hypothetical protein
MKKLLFIFAVLALAPSVWSAQQPVTTIEVPASGSINFKTYTNTHINPRFTAAQNNFDELYTDKANVSCFANATAFNACFDLDWPTLVTRDSLGLGTGDSPSFASINVASGNLMATNNQVTKAWQSGLSYTADVTSVIHGGQHYIATSTHIAAAVTEPGVGANWATVWKIDATDISGKQDTLQSGINIKTINNNSLLGPGNIIIEGGSGIEYTLPIAEAEVLGGVKIGQGLTIASDGTLSADDQTADLGETYQAILVSGSTLKTINNESLLGSGNINITTGSGGISHATSNAEYYASMNGAWASLTGIFQPYDSNLPAWPSAVTSTEVSYLAGVTSSIQEQLDSKPAIVGLTTSGITGNLTLSKTGTTARTVTFPDAAGTVALTSSDITGNAATATALAANPTDCGEGQYAQSIDASGNLTCAQIEYAQISGTPTIPTVSDNAYDATTWDGNTDAPSKNAVKNKIESLALGASTATANIWQESQTHLKAVTAPEYLTSAADGERVSRIYNTVAITTPPLIASIGWWDDRYWIADGTSWTNRWILDSSMIGVSGGVQLYDARLGTLVEMSGNSKYIGTNSAGTFGVYDLPTGGGPAYTLPPATTLALGGIIVGNNLSVDASGVLSANDQSYSLPIATSQALGGVKAGQRVSIAQDGTLSADDQTPAAATANTLGVVRPGSGLSVDASGVLSVTLSEAASGYVTPPPTYSDSPCTAGQYAVGGGYQYICTATNTWDRVALTSWNNPAPQAQPPTLTARNIQASGTALQVTGSRSLKAGAGGTGGWSMDCTTAGTVAVTYTSGLPGTTVNFGLDKTILGTDTCTLSYANPGTGIVASDDDLALASFSGAAVYNGSTQGGGGGPDYVPYQAHFYFGEDSDTGVEEARICIFQGNGTLVQCTSKFDATSVASGNIVLSGNFVGASELDSGSYLLGIVSDGYIRYVPNPNSESWATSYVQEYNIDNPENITLPAPSDGASMPAVWVTNANGDVILGNSNVSLHTGQSEGIGPSSETLYFWEFTRVTLP